MIDSADQQLKNFMAVADLQNELLNLNFHDESVIKNFITKLSSSPLLDSKWTFRSVLISIYTCFLSHPLSDFDYINLFIEIAKNPKNSFLSDDYIINFTNKFFIYQLYKSGLVNIKSIYDESLRSSYFCLYFYPEISLYYPDSILVKHTDFITDVRDNIISSGYQLDVNDSQSILDKFIEFRSRGTSPNPVALAIRCDDVERLQQLLSQTNTSYNSRIEKSIFERFVFINNNDLSKDPILIEYAAFFSSIKCFKFLYQQSDCLPQSLATFAVAGGNYEIIHLCEQGKIQFDDYSLMISIRFFRSELTEYLEDNFDIKKTVDDVSKSLIFYNLQALIDCESVIYEDPNKRDSNGYNALSLSSLNGDLDIINYLILTFGSKIDVNAQNKYHNSPLYDAAGHGHFEVVKYLCSIPEIDINIQNDKNQTALHYAAEKGYLNIVEFLCSLPNIDLNADSGGNYHPIDAAFQNGHIDIINYLASLPGIFIYDENAGKYSILEYSIMSRRVEVVKLAWELICKTIEKSDKIENKEDFIKNNKILRDHKTIATTFSLYVNEAEINNFLKTC